MEEETVLTEGLNEEVKEERSVEDSFYAEEKPESEEKVSSQEDPTDEKLEEDKSDENTEEDQGKEDPKDIEYKLELSENSILGDSFKKDVETFAKENQLSNEVAQEILSKQEEAISDYVDSVEKDRETQLDAWRQEVINDKVMGGDNLKKTINDAQKVVKKFGSEDFIKLLNDSGYGDNPQVVKFLAGVGNMMSDDSLVLPKAAGTSKSVEEIFYGNK